MDSRKRTLSECEYSIHALSAPSASTLLEYYSVLRKYVEHEDELINARLTWSLTIHGFLFAAFALLLSKAADVVIALPTLDPSGITKARADFIIVALIFFLQAVIAMAGRRVSYIARGAIEAAHESLLHLSAIAQSAAGGMCPANRNTSVEQLFFLPTLLGGGAGNPKLTDAAGEYYTRLPGFLMGVWLFLGVAAAIAAAIAVVAVVLTFRM
jgi:hypothetical protein